jgi:hypothetical protein
MGILDKYEKEYQKVQCEKKENFVTKVACTRELEHVNLPSSSNNNKKNNINFVRASNKCNKLDCDSCPAGGYWDHMGQGMFCFHRAYYLGKSGKPVPCDVAKDNCPLQTRNFTI